MRNMIQAGFAGEVWPVNRRHARVAERPACRNIASLPTAPDLAVICTPAAGVPALIAELGEKGCKAAVVLSAGLHEQDTSGRSLQTLMLEAAKPHLLRILGPNCVGLLIPPLGLNASFAPLSPRPGQLAFLSQSGALTTALLDWADSRSIGFSHFVSMGDCADVDFGDVIDHLASDPATHAILMYMESVQNPRKFLSAARAASRNKPVLVVKAGRAPGGAKAAASHTGALAGADDVFDAAIRRAGMLRVDTLLDLFDAAQTLSRARRPAGERLLIMTNGGGAGVLAADAMSLQGGQLAELGPRLTEQLDTLLPDTWSRANPIDIIGDAPVDRYVQTLRVLLADPKTDAVLFMHAPTAIVPSADIARACLPIMNESGRTVLTSWLGSTSVEEAKKLSQAANIPTYDTPEQAVAAFLQLANFRRNQETLLQTPTSLAGSATRDVERARRVFDAATKAGRTLLTELEAKEVLTAYGIPVAQSRFAATPEAAAQAASEIGFPVVIKIVSPTITHKSDVGGVILNLETAVEVESAAREMKRKVAGLRPDAALSGFSVQSMVRKPRAHELIVGAATDPIFGPVILFGQGGTAVEVVRDRAVALPPLNTLLARDLISRTRVSKLLAGYRDRAPVDHDALCLVLLKISQMICDLGELGDIDINPLLADDQGVIALDARITLTGRHGDGRERLSIHPYPAELEMSFDLNGRSFVMRPIRPEDETALRAFYADAPVQDLRLRFFARRSEFPHSELARYSQIDFEREMSFVAFDANDAAQTSMLGYVCALTDPDNAHAEFAVQVHPKAKRQGLARRLMTEMIEYLRHRGVEDLAGECLAENDGMVTLARNLGFQLHREGSEYRFVLPLKPGR